MPEYFTGTVCLKSVTRNWMSSVPAVFCDAALLHHAAEPKSFAGRQLCARDDLRRIEEEHDVAAERLRVPSHAATLTPSDDAGNR